MNKDFHLIHLEIIRSLEVAAHGIADFLLFAPVAHGRCSLLLDYDVIDVLLIS